MSNPPTVTIDTLNALGACDEEKAVFAQTFPEGCVLTPDNLAKAHEAYLTVTWLACVSGDPHVLAALAHDADSDVRERVAMNRRTPPAVLDVLAKDVDKWVRVGVARNERTTAASLGALATDPEETVRWYANRDGTFTA